MYCYVIRFATGGFLSREGKTTAHICYARIYKQRTWAEAYAARRGGSVVVCRIINEE